MTFGEYLKNLREKEGMSLREFSKKTGISHSALCKIENNKTTPDTLTFKKLVSEVGIDANEALKYI